VKRFTVIYEPDAEKALAYLVGQHWNTPMVAKISLASNRIDKLLSGNPEDWGSPVHDNVRLLWVPPLEIMYVVFDEDRQVVVFDVKLVPDRK
jgi:hypothetical protein